MNLPARLRHWDVHGESLAIEGNGSDVIIDWIADDEDETAKSQINRLMGVILIFYFLSQKFLLLLCRLFDYYVVFFVP